MTQEGDRRQAVTLFSYGGICVSENRGEQADYGLAETKCLRTCQPAAQREFQALAHIYEELFAQFMVDPFVVDEHISLEVMLETAEIKVGGAY